MCRDCCCGSSRKHPDVDHDGLLDLLTAAVGDHAEVVRSTCLLACEESNVVVVLPGSAGRAGGGRPAWFRSVLTPEAVERVAAFVTAGGPGLASTRGLADLVMAAPGLASLVVPDSSIGASS